MTVPQQAQVDSQTRCWTRRGSPKALVHALTAFGAHAERRGGAVQTWLPGREGISVMIVPGCQTERDRRWLKHRVWTWQRGSSFGSRLRADTTGVAIGVTTLLSRGG